MFFRSFQLHEAFNCTKAEQKTHSQRGVLVAVVGSRGLSASAAAALARKGMSGAVPERQPFTRVDKLTYSEHMVK